MAVIYNAALKNARMVQVENAIDGGAGPGTLELGTASMAAILAIFTLVDPAGVVAADVLTLDFDPDLSTTGLAAAGAGTPAVEARIKDSAGTVVISGLTVGLSGTNIVMDNNNIANGQAVSMTTGTITHG